MAVLTPTTTPSVSKLGPPELPVLMGASPRHLVAKLPLEMPAMTQPWPLVSPPRQRNNTSGFAVSPEWDPVGTAARYWRTR